MAESIITFLENKRALYNPSDFEVPEQCTSSILTIRDYLAGKMEDLDRSSELAKNLRTMQAERREFLDVAQKLDRDPFLSRGRYYVQEFYGSLGELRKAFGFCLFQIMLTYGLTIEGKLASILPASEN